MNPETTTIQKLAPQLRLDLTFKEVGQERRWRRGKALVRRINVLIDRVPFRFLQGDLIIEVLDPSLMQVHFKGQLMHEFRRVP